MSQELVMINDVAVKQPSSFEPNWEVTYTEDSGRVFAGQAVLDPLFTVESYSAEFTSLTKEEASEILQMIVPTPGHPSFELHYYSWYYGEWRTGTFYVGRGTMKVRTLKDDDETLRSITCNFIGVNPIV